MNRKTIMAVVVLAAGFSLAGMRTVDRSGDASRQVVVAAGTDAAVKPGRFSEFKRVILPERLERGNTAIVPLSPVDSAAWIAPADRTIPKEGLFLKFRKEFDADGVTPLRFHVSADERFVLMLDGETVVRGPDRGAPDMWFFQSYETVPEKGRHVFDAVVWKMAPGQPPLAQLSCQLGFVFAAEGIYDAQLTTGKARWRVAKLGRTAMTRHFYQGGCGAECVVRGRDILSEEPDAQAWTSPVAVRSPVVPNPSRSSRKPGWLVYPSQLPAQIAHEVRPGRCVAVDDQAFVTNGVRFKSGPHDVWGSNAVFRAESAADPRRAKFDALLRGERPLEIPAHTSVRFLWNLGDYYCAYPVMKTRGGEGATVGWSWAEALFVGDCFDWHTVVTDKVRKGLGDRNEFVGKYFYGKEDRFLPEGPAGRFTVPWWNCGVYCLIEVKTGDAPLTIDRVALVETRYPFEPEAYFHCDDESLEAVQRICLRGLQMCMHEMHFDCPYYEQQMYGGDTRLQMMMCQALSPDDALNRQAFRLFEVSQRDNGMISMNYPTTWLQESTSFSQYWGMMLGDYAMWRDNPEWVRARMPAVRRMLFGLERHLDADGFQSGTPGWYFVDWVPDWPSGTAPGHDGNRSAVDNLLYLLTLRKAAFVETSIGEAELAARWTRRADALAKGIAARFWCERRGLVADTPEMDRFSEHAQALAVLTGVLTPEREARVAEGLASADDLARCTASFSSYLFEAYFKLGRTGLFLKKLDTWRAYVKMGLHTPLEGPGDARSDCHAWSSNPLYHLHTGIAGVNPAEPGFRSVRLAPQPGPLKWIKSKTSTPKGYVVQDLRFEGGKVVGTVTLPPGLAGEFVWRGTATPLVPGENGIGR